MATFEHPVDLKEARRCAAIFLDQLAIPVGHGKRCDELGKEILDTINLWIERNPPEKE